MMHHAMGSNLQQKGLLDKSPGIMLSRKLIIYDHILYDFLYNFKNYIIIEMVTSNKNVWEKSGMGRHQMSVSVNTVQEIFCLF